MPLRTLAIFHAVAMLGEPDPVYSGDIGGSPRGKSSYEKYHHARRGGAAASHALKGARYAGQAKVSLAAARSTALKARPGTITDLELEREAGANGLRYSFDIKAGGKTYEVGVDAKTGTVLENATEGAHPD